MPTISVIIPAYNSAATIIAALESIRLQTVQPDEVIVVNDASTDDTVQVVERYLREQIQDGSESAVGDQVASSPAGRVSCPPLKVSSAGWFSTVRLLQMQKNGGPAAARNRGMAEARSEWIAFLDADDVWLPDKIERQSRILSVTGGAVLVCGATVPLETEGLVTGRTETAAESGSLGVQSDAVALSLSQFRVCNPVATSTVLVNKKAAACLGGFDEQFRGPEDYDLWMRLAAKGTLIRMPDRLACYREVADGLSLNHRKFLPQVLRVVDKAYGPGGALHGGPGRRQARAYQFLAAAWSAAAQHEIALAYGLYLRSLLQWPGRFSLATHLGGARRRLAVSIARSTVECWVRQPTRRR
jgi:glycosyltransferase involved in cell wall biosynthesis